MQVPKQLREPFLEAVRAGRIRSMQNKLMPAAPIHTPGALLLGDAFNMRHPLTGTDGFSTPRLMKLPLTPIGIVGADWHSTATTQHAALAAC